MEYGIKKSIQKEKRNSLYSIFPIPYSTQRGFTRQNFSKKNLGGFTLVEMIVSIGLFTIVLFIATNAFLTVVAVDRKSRAIRIGVDNMNLALEDMQRRIKTGSNYFCGESVPVVTFDCGGATTFSFLEQDGQTRTIYAYDATSKAIYRASYGPSFIGETIRVTAPEISVTGATFIVRGSYAGIMGDGGDSAQPHVTIAIKGSIAGQTPTVFNVQSTITQRNYDS